VLSRSRGMSPWLKSSSSRSVILSLNVPRMEFRHIWPRRHFPILIMPPLAQTAAPPKWSKDYIVEGQEKTGGTGGAAVGGSSAGGNQRAVGHVQSGGADAESEGGGFSFGGDWNLERVGDGGRGNKVSGGIAALKDNEGKRGEGSARRLLVNGVEDDDGCSPAGEENAKAFAERHGWKLNSVTDCIAG